MNNKIRLGMSSCLLGENVRYDGGHKLDNFLRDTLGQWVDYVPVCPEKECGLPVPREPMRLEGDPTSPRLIVTRTRRDITDQMMTWVNRRIVGLGNENLHGFIFKSRSPSCGIEQVKVIDEREIPHKIGVGLFAQAFMDHFPLLPVEEEDRLNDPALRENFISRIFTLKRWRETPQTVEGLVEFNAHHKLQIMAHSVTHLRQMDKLVADLKKIPVAEAFQQYLEILMPALKLRATCKKNTNILMHILGCFKKQLSADEKQEALEKINLYHNQVVPLIVPITLLNHYGRKYDQPYLKQQVYLNPHPAELMLRNHV
ncbi:DUF523 and DUF1722 domain-containing protein [bacterium]|nr:DUF523 and DUF1722 domain-containing protein [bacterium]MBU1651769.1 DUF523 and DUF1722 domain-containing protein [bacterium]MBU1881506.1 DUF523 and DUF1722 domain-containing protein [bacterium]